MSEIPTNKLLVINSDDLQRLMRVAEAARQVVDAARHAPQDHDAWTAISSLIAEYDSVVAELDNELGIIKTLDSSKLPERKR